MELAFKFCKACNKSKPLDFFNNHKRNKDGKNYECRDCTKSKQKLYSKKFRESEKGKQSRGLEKCKLYHKEYIKEYQKTEKHKSYQKKYFRLETTKIKQRKETENLSFNYLRDTLRKKGFTLDQIKTNKELTEVQKLIIKTKRLCKTLQN
jgi:hypothetical protein